MKKRKPRGSIPCSCVICKRELTVAGLHTHVLRTHEHDPRFDNVGYDNSNPNHKRSNQYLKAVELGIDKPTWSDDRRLNASQAMKDRNQHYWTMERRQQHSAIMLQVVKNNPNSYSYDNVCRRTKREYYNGELFHSPWEIIVAKYLDSIEVSWTRQVTPFEYEFEGKPHLYFPDFYLDGIDKFIEVKGYAVDKDIAKWSAVGSRLIIIKEKQITQIKNGTYILEV